MLRLRLPLARFVSAGEVFVGKGSLAALRALDAARAVVLVSRSIARDAGLAGKVAAGVSAHAVKIVEAPTGEPDMAAVSTVLREVNAFQPDWIVAVGGGSVLDLGKLVWVFYEHPDAALASLARPFSLPGLRGKCRFAAVPTTAGTGSEVSSATVVADETGAKIALVSHDLLPDVVVLDPTLTAGVPQSVVASAGLDALAHAVESYVSRFANTLADTFAESAARTLFQVLPATWAKPEDPEARLEAMQAAMLAGWVQNLKVPGVGHAIAHQLGRLGVAHGAACGALLEPSIRFNAAQPAARARYDRLARAVGWRDTAELCGRIGDLRAAIGSGRGLAGLAAEGAAAIAAQRETITAGALRDVCARANPRDLDAAGVHEVLSAAI